MMENRKHCFFFSLFFILSEVAEESCSLRAVEWLSVCLECPLPDRCSSNNGRRGYGGGRRTCQSRRSQYTSISGSCQSPERSWSGTRERERETEAETGQEASEKAAREKMICCHFLVLKIPQYSCWRWLLCSCQEHY